MDARGVEVRDLAYDYYGQRVATCSSDQIIRVFNQAGVLTAVWKAHLGSIWRIAWAHPEFGQVLVTCSFDRKICIWEEHADAEDLTQQIGTGPGGWRLQAELLEARDTLHDITLAPKHLGLRLASCGADRFVRVHEAPDVVDLSKWSLLAEFEADGSSGTSGSGLSGSSLGVSSGNRASPNCIAWCPSKVDAAMLAVGMGDGAVHVWECNDGGGWTRLQALEPKHLDCVHDLDWVCYDTN